VVNLALLGCALVLVVAAALWYRWDRRARPVRVVPSIRRRAAPAVPLRDEDHDDLRVQVDARAREVVIQVLGLPRGLRLVREARARSGDVRGVSLGSEAFDSRFVVGGDERIARAVLDGPTRTALIDLATQGRISVDDGALTRQVARWRVANDVDLDHEVELTLALAEHLQVAPGAILGRLEQVAQFDPDVSVRCGAVRVLQQLDPPRAMRIVSNLLQDDYAVRIEVAHQLGFGELLNRYAVDPLLPRSLRGRALNLAIHSSPSTELIRSVLSDGSPSEHEAACQAVVRLGRPEVLQALLEHTRVRLEGNDLDPTRSQHIADALRRIADPATVPLLLSMLAAGGDRIAVLDALRAAGTPEAIPAITRYLTVSHPPLVLAAEAALEAIRGRHQRSGGGALSLVDDTAGALSTCPASGGLTLLPEPESSRVR